MAGSVEGSEEVLAMKDTVALRRTGLCINQQFRFQNLASPLPVTVIFLLFFLLASK
jgi:hypothetical protein